MNRMRYFAIRRFYFRDKFTLIEVLFAIVVAGVGVLALLSLMFNIYDRSRDTAVASRISYQATQFCNYLKHNIRNDWPTYVDTINGTADLPVHSGGIFNKDGLYDALNDAGWQLEPDTTIYVHTSSTRPGLYKVVDDDFAASVRVWQDQLPALEHVGGEPSVTINDTDAVNVFIEITWPYSRPYTSRKRWDFQFTVLKPD